MAISEDDSTIVIGAPGRDQGIGKVYVFKKPEGGWLNTSHHYPLGIDSGAAGDRLGQSVAVSSDGSVITIGAPGAGGGKGAIYVVTDFDPEGTERIIRIDGPSDFKGTGISIDIAPDGKTIAAGGYGYERCGSVCVYRCESGVWDDTIMSHEWHGDPAKEGQDGAMLGFSVDLARGGKQLFKGAPLFNEGAGEVIVFSLEQE